MRKLFLATLFFSFATLSYAKKDKATYSDLVFCIDMSGSARGVFDSFKNMYWKMVNEAQIKAGNKILRIGIIGYSRNSFSADSGYVKIFAQPSENFDQTFLTFCGIKTYIEGGTQMIGVLIDVATKRIEWSKTSGSSRAIIIIGNGSVRLGKINYKAAVIAAKRKGIAIHGLYLQAGKNRNIEEWQQLADRSGTQLFASKLNDTSCFNSVALDSFRIANTTFNNHLIYYGENGKTNFDNLVVADNLTPDYGLNDRYSFKARIVSGEASAHWELISHYNNGDFDLMNIDREKLPFQFQTLVAEQMLETIRNKSKERDTDLRSFKEIVGRMPLNEINYQPLDDKSYRLNAAMIMILRDALSH
ncbi:MAG: VWA domain-containing protein [Bacteroidetes bacterium]|nr:VWA domain-containing protein [Bacteroidota bacterium]